MSFVTTMQAVAGRRDHRQDLVGLRRPHRRGVSPMVPAKAGRQDQPRGPTAMAAAVGRLSASLMRDADRVRQITGQRIIHRQFDTDIARPASDTC